jgi:transposase
MIEAKRKMAPPSGEVLMLVPEVVRQIRQLRDIGWGAKRIAGQLGVARGTVRRYMRAAGDGEVVQRRPGAWTLGSEARELAVELLDGAAAGNGPVVRRLLRERGIETPLRTLQRVLTPHRRARGAAEAATVRYETAPGHQMQIDFGEKHVAVAGQVVRVHLFVAVLGYSRRLFVRASLSQRQDDWAEGLAGAFRHFGGVPQTLLLDNAGALVTGRDRETNTARLHPGFAAFCRDWEVKARVCQPYRARTKGKTESGVGYVKHNGLAALSFASFEALQSHLGQWMLEADGRIHGTTRERPTDRFERDERAALRALPASPLAVRQRRVERKVATDCFVDVDTVRYSVPHALVRQVVEVLVGDDEVRIYTGNVVVARHRRSLEPHSRIVEPAHLAGLWRPTQHGAAEPSSPPQIGRSLADYAAVIGGVP